MHPALQLTGRQLLLTHSLFSLTLGAILARLDNFDNLLILLNAPVVAAAAAFPRRIYIPVAAISLGVSLAVILLISHGGGSSLQTLASLATAIIVVSELLYRQNQARTRAERRSAAFVALGQRLNLATIPADAARIIAETADTLIGWDAYVLDLYHPETDSVESVLLIDTIDGLRQLCTANQNDRSPSSVLRHTISHGALLITSDEQHAALGLMPFGNKSRSSASLMFAPIRTGTRTIGVLSIQSYTAHAYTPDDLAALQALADYCAGGLERLRAEIAVRENETRYRVISELTSDYFFSMTILPDGRRQTDWITENSFSRITGYSIAEFEACGGWMAIVHPDDRPVAEQRAQRVLAGQNDVSEMRIVTRGGELRWIRAYSRPFWGEAEGRVTRMIGAMQDITERKQAEEALLQHQKLESLGALTGGIAHDFNNLLTVIVGNAELALVDIPAGSAALSAVDQISSAAEQAVTLTRQMLAYAGQGNFSFRPVSLNQVVEELLGLLQPSLPAHVLVQPQLAPNLPLIEADHAQISHLLLNLIVNAVEAIGEQSGTIAVRTLPYELRLEELATWSYAVGLRPGPCICLEVADDGVGMDAITRARIFDPFFSTKFTGRGLGLAAVLGIVRSHRGTLDVQTAPGKGATFTVLLPLRQ